MTVRCPRCGRKQEVGPVAGRFLMPDHDNYTKTTDCPGGGRTYELAGPEPVPAHSMRPLPRPAALAAALLGMAALQR